MSKSTAVAYNALGEPADKSFVGILADRENNQALIFLSCTFRPRMMDIVEELKLVTDETARHELLDELAALIVNHDDSKRFTTTKYPYIICIFGEDEFETRFQFKIQLTPAQLQLLSNLYLHIYREKSTFRSIDNFIQAVSTVAQDKRFAVKIIDTFEVNNDRGSGHIC